MHSHHQLCQCKVTRLSCQPTQLFTSSRCWGFLPSSNPLPSKHTETNLHTLIHKIHTLKPRQITLLDLEGLLTCAAQPTKTRGSDTGLGWGKQDRLASRGFLLDGTASLTLSFNAYLQGSSAFRMCDR